MAPWFLAAAAVYAAYRFIDETQLKGKKKSLKRARSPYEILGVSRKATLPEVKRAYQSLVGQYHPDRVANAAPEIQRLAEKRTKALNLAYGTLKKRLSERDKPAQPTS